MKHYGLIGKTLEHSFSQNYFSQKFAEEKIDADYALCEMASLDQVDSILSQNWSGLNVTIPYKTAIIPHLDLLDENAQKIGAVNTIKFIKQSDKQHLIGFNTDCIGFEESLKPLLKNHHKSALVLGTGGASKAITFVLDKLGIKWIYVSREAGEGCLDYAEVDSEVIRDNKLIINTTPLGMFPEIESYPDIPYKALTPQHLLYDLVYNPTETEFLKRGKAFGATTKNGLEMLHLQAEAAYEIWTR